jgi:hypothetical protein
MKYREGNYLLAKYQSFLKTNKINKYMNNEDIDACMV